MNKNVKKIMMILFLIGFTFVVLSGNVFAEEDGGSTGSGTTKTVVASSPVSCKIGSNDITIPDEIVKIIASVVKLIKIGVPVILIVLGMIDLGKSVATQKEEDIKKGQKTLMSRCIAAAIVFFVVAIVQLLLSIINNGSSDNSVWKCVCSLVGNTNCN